MYKRLTFATAVLIVCATAPFTLVTSGEPAPPEVIKTEPIYQFRNGQWLRLFKTGASSPTQGGPWKSEGVVAHAPLPGDQTTPVYLLIRTDADGFGLLYTNNKIQANLKQVGQNPWKNDGVAFHVAREQLPGTAPFYQMKTPGLTKGTIGIQFAIGDKDKANSWGDLAQVVATIGYVFLQPPKPKISIKPDTSGKFHPPSIAITGIQDVPPGSIGGPRTQYRIAVNNWENYPQDLYQFTKNVLPSHPCGDTRAWVLVWIVKGNKPPEKRGCVALAAPDYFKKMDIMVPGGLTEDDEVFIVMDDRLTGIKYESERFKVGWYGVGKLLGPVGCKSFLGRASHYLCTTEQGMTACENLVKKGKPIKCTRPGKPQ